MRAAVLHGYGSLDRLRVEDVPAPTPGPRDVRVRVCAAAVTIADTMTLTGRPLVVRFFTGLRRPKRPVQGSEFAGVIEAVGSEVTRFAVGDEVLGATGSDASCFAELTCTPEDGFLALKPEVMTHEEAAPVCSALAAWNFLHDKADVQPRQRVLVLDASSEIGVSAVQVAHHLGADVTAACRPEHADLAASLGADRVIDSTTDDVGSGGATYDVIFDTDSTSSFGRCRRSLTRDGVYLGTFPGPALLLQMLWTARFGRRKAIFSATGLLPVAERLGYLEEVTALVEAGALRAVVDRSFPLEQITAAYAYAEEGHGNGAVVVTMPAD